MKINIPLLFISLICVLSISICINIFIYNKYVDIDENAKLVEIILNQPDTLNLPEDNVRHIKSLFTIYNDVTQDNYKTYSDYGNSVFAIKGNCILRALKLINNGSTRDFRAYKLYTPGGLSHGLLTYATGMEKYSNDEVEIYIHNLTKIMEAIPKNIPDKSILTKESINSITYYADYARIVYDIDMKIEKIDNDRSKYIGKRYIDKITR